MVFRTSAFRSKVAVCAAATALLAGLTAVPAVAGPSHKLLPYAVGSGTQGETVGQALRKVNHRDDRSDRHARPPIYPVQPGKSGKNRRDHADDDDDGRDNRHTRQRPRHADNDRRRYDREPRWPSYGHRYDRGYKYRPSPPRYRQYYGHPRPYPIVVVPYHVHRQPVVDYHPHRQAADSCGQAPTQRYAYRGGSHQAGGTVIGGVVGAVVGSQIGKGNGRLAAVGVGTLLGAMIGQDVGRSMDAADRAYTTGSVGHALETAPTCTTITWDNPDSGNYGSVTPTNTYEASPGRYCREFQQQVVVGGQIQDAYGTACRQPDGSWEIVAGQP